MDAIEALLTRRSIRRFKPDPVPLELVLKLIDIARYAPSARNSQPWRFIIVDDPSIKEKLSRIHGGAKPLMNAPLGIVVACVKDESPISYLLDCANATIYFMLAAHAHGLGTVWIQTLRNIDEIREILSIPENVIPAAILALGYPDEKPFPKPRKPVEEITFRNKYGEKIRVLNGSRN
ncbi:MAG: nitroreductase family protein [Pyrodictiaceae archaeon]